MNSRVHIVAVSGRTPVGATAEHSTAAVRAGISRLREHPFMVDASGEPLRAALDPLLPPEVNGRQRMLALARAALSDLVSGLTWSLPNTGTIPLLLGVPEYRPGWKKEDERWLVDRLSVRMAPGGNTWRVDVVARGHAACLEGIRLAAERIARGAMTFCVIGGVDSYFQADTLEWLESERRIATSETRSGFSPGEGAGFIALASDSLVSSLAVPTSATVGGAYSSQESRCLGSDQENIGSALTRSVRGASLGCRDGGERIDAIYCDLNGERYRTEEWGFAALRTQHLFRDVTRVEAVCDAWGDVGAATGALLVMLAVQAWRRGYASGPRAMVWAGSDGGLRASVVLAQGTRRDHAYRL